MFEYTTAQKADIRALLLAKDYPGAYNLAADLADGGAGVDDASIIWMRGAAQVNAGQGPFSLFIRSYTQAQYQARYGATSSAVVEAKIQEASDNIAETVLSEILETGHVPPLSTIADQDALPAAQLLFDDDAGGWAGNPLFLGLGYGVPLTRNIVENPQSTYDALAMVKFALSSGTPLSNFQAVLSLIGSGGLGGTINAGAAAAAGFVEINDFLIAAYGGMLPTIEASGSALYDQIKLGQLNADDTLTGSGTRDFIHGGSGDDTILASGGYDVLDGGVGKDKVDYGSSGAIDVTIKSSESTLVYVGAVNANGLDSLFNIEEIRGSGQNDFFQIQSFSSGLQNLSLDGAGGVDTLSTFYFANAAVFNSIAGTLELGSRTVEFKGFEKLEGGDGSDRFIIDGTIQAVDGRDGRDYADFSLSSQGVVVGGANGVGINNIEVVYGSELNDTIRATDTGVVIFGRDGIDTLVGGSGVDVLDGGTGADILTGGGGADYFVVGQGDVIGDAGVEDRMGLTLKSVISGVALRAWVDPAESDWETRPYEMDNGFVFVRSGSTLFVTQGGATIAIVENWSEGQLGIFLTDKPKPPTWDDRDPVTPPRSDPLVLDLDGGGITLYATNQSQANFDLDGDGFAERVGWFGAGEGLLVHDTDGDGVVDGIGELFGDATHDGFQALAALDANGDGQISAYDPTFADLRVWRDANGDGLSQPDELQTLTQAGVVNLSLQTSILDQTVNGNFVPLISSFERVDGTSGQTASVYLARQTLLSTWLAPVGFEIDPMAASLPELRGYGTVKNLSAAMTLDPSLQAEVIDFLVDLSSQSILGARGDFEALLLDWAGVDPQVAGSRGDQVDADHLAIVEAFFGTRLSQIVAGVTTDSPDARAGSLVEYVYTTLVDELFIRFLAQATSGGVAAQGSPLDLAGTAFSIIQLIGFDAADDGLVADPATMIAALVAGAPADLAERAIYYENGLSLIRMALPETEEVQAAALLAPALADFSLQERNAILTVALGPTHLLGTDGADYLSASGNEGLFIGGLGDDYNQGSSLVDSYFYSGGDGQDTISDFGVSTFSVEDRLYFGTGIAPSDLTVTSETEFLRLSFPDGGSVSIAGQSSLPGYGVELFVFSDGSTLTPQDIFAIYLASAGTAGDDRIYGGYLDDQIIGGLGSDTLFGGRGRDTYVYNLGDGDDIIDDDTEYGPLPAIADNVLEFGAGFYTSNIRVSRDFGSSDYLLSFKDQEGSIRLRDGAGDGAVGTIDFADGTVWHREELRAFYLAHASTNQDDVIIGYFGDETFAGGLGDDFLAAEWGSDTYLYNLGDGHDTISDGAVYRDDVNHLVLGASITPETVSYSRNVTDFIITFADGGSVTLSYQFEPESGLQFVDFAGGFSLTWDDMWQMFSAGTSGDDELWGSGEVDTLQGGLGDDTLRGGDDTDTYIYTIGDGQDTIVEHDQYGQDVLVLEGVNQADLQITRDGDDAIVSFVNAAGQIHLVDQFIDLKWDDTGIEAIGFADGQWDRQAIQQFYLSSLATTGDDHIVGFTTSDDTLTGGQGNDVLDGQGGSDLYVFAPDDGAETIIDWDEDEGGGGEGPVITDSLDLTAYAMSDVILTIDDCDLFVSFSGSTDTIRIVDQLRSLVLEDGYVTAGVEQILFADGALGDRDAIASAAGFVPMESYIEGTEGDDVLLGNARDNEIDARLGDDQVSGAEGDDLFLMSADDGDDAYDGGSGFDLLTYDGVTGSVWVSLATGATGGAAGTDILTSVEGVQGGLGNDHLTGNDGDNELHGAGGDDVVIGGAGNDMLDGGTGIDTLSFIAANQAITVDLSVMGAQNTGAGVDLVTGFEILLGSAFDDDVTGGLAVDRLEGLDGDDQLRGFGSGDVLFGGLGADVLSGATAASAPIDQSDLDKPQSMANISLGAALTLTGAFDRGVDDPNITDATALPHATVHAVASGAGAEFYAVTGQAGALAYFDIDGADFDTVIELLDADGGVIASNDDSDEDPGSAGGLESFLAIHLPDDGVYYLRVTEYGDNPPSAGAAYTLHVSLEGVDFTGQTPTTVGAGTDMHGGEGNDQLLAGFGDDGLWGDTGNDQFVFDGPSGHDRIYDFKLSGDADVIELRGGLFADFNALLASAQQVGDDTVISFDAEESLTLENVTLTSLNQTDFLFA